MSSDNRPADLMLLAMALPVLQRSYAAAADKVVAHLGLSLSLASPLVMLGRLGDAVRPGVLAEAMGIEAPSLVRSLEQLIDAGLAERRDDPLDRRARTLHLTAAGEAARDQIETALQAMRTEVFGDVSDSDIKAGLRLFARLGARLGCTLPLMAPPAAADGAKRAGRR